MNGTDTDISVEVLFYFETNLKGGIHINEKYYYLSLIIRQHKANS